MRFDITQPNPGRQNKTMNPTGDNNNSHRDSTTDSSDFATTTRRKRRLSTSSLSSTSEMKLLDPDFNPGPHDVICARGKIAQEHTGNRRFQVIIDMNVDKYEAAKSKMEKSVIVSSIVDAIRAASPQGGFVRQDNLRWHEVGDLVAREKVGQSFRNVLHEKYRSSEVAKKLRREKLESATCSQSKDAQKKAPPRCIDGDDKGTSSLHLSGADKNQSIFSKEDGKICAEEIVTKRNKCFQDASVPGFVLACDEAAATKQKPSNPFHTVTEQQHDDKLWAKLAAWNSLQLPQEKERAVTENGRKTPYEYGLEEDKESPAREKDS